MRDTQFIPEKYRLQVHRGYGDVPHAFPRPFSTTEQVQKEINRVISYGSKDPEYDNKPLGGYHIMVGNQIEVFHPDGYSLNLTMLNIGIILRECKVEQGIIEDELIFIFDKSYKEFVLVPYNRSTYHEIKKQSDEFYAAKNGTTELSYGCCVDFSGRKFMYLGKYWISTINKTGMRIVDRYLLLDQGGRFYITTTKVPDAITDEKVNTCPDEADVLDVVERTGLNEITTFYKTGSYNSTEVEFDRMYITKEKPTKKDFSFDVVPSSAKHKYEYTLRDYPIFLSDDGNYYAAVHSYGTTLAYSLSSYDVGNKIKAIPFDPSTLSVDGERTPSNNYKNCSTQKIVKLAFPKLVKK